MDFCSIEEDEQIIKLLEEIDENFSILKSTLKDLRMKIGKMSENSKSIVEDCRPWTKFFEMQTKEDFSPFSDLHLNSLKYNEIYKSPENLNNTAPKNPFVEQESSELLNRSIMKNLKINTGSLSSTPIIHAVNESESQNNTICNDSEEADHEIIPFEKDLLPEIFQNEDDLVKLYEFIQSRRTVTLSDISNQLKDTPLEKIEILVSVLARKRFVRIKRDKITIEKQ